MGCSPLPSMRSPQPADAAGSTAAKCLINPPFSRQQDSVTQLEARGDEMRLGAAGCHNSEVRHHSS